MRRIELAGVVAGAVVAGTFEYLLPTLVASGETGPTAASVDTAFLFAIGTAIGVTVGGLIASVVSKAESFSDRFAVGVRSGALAGAIAVIPPVIVLEHFHAFEIAVGLIGASVWVGVFAVL